MITSKQRDGDEEPRNGCQAIGNGIGCLTWRWLKHVQRRQTMQCFEFGIVLLPLQLMGAPNEYNTPLAARHELGTRAHRNQRLAGAGAVRQCLWCEQRTLWQAKIVVEPA